MVNSVFIARADRYGEQLIKDVKNGSLTPQLALNKFCAYFMLNQQDVADILKLLMLKRAAEIKELKTNEAEILVEGVAI